MIRIALVAVNARYSHSNLALLYLEKAFKDLADPAVETVDLLEWNINRPPRELLERLEAGGYSHLAFSVYIWNTLYLEQFLPDLSRLTPEAVIALGGPEAVHRAEHWLGTEGTDYILCGAAEAFAEILPSLEKPPRPQVLTAQRRPFAETSFPYTQESLPRLKGRLLYYEASRGCLFQCAYCLSARGDERPDYRRTEDIMEEIALLARFEGTVKFVDRTFNANPEVSRLIWRYLIDHPPAGCFHFEIHPLLLREEDFALLERLPGAAQFEIGLQSTDSRILERINRSGNWETERAAIGRLKAIDSFHLHLDQIVGLPGDTPETAARTLDDIIALEPDDFQLGFLKLLPGTPLADRQEAEGLTASAVPPYEILATPGFPFAALQHFHKIEKLIELFFNKRFFRLSVKRAAEIAGGHHAFFTALLKAGEADLDCRRWEYWGEKILAWIDADAPGERPDLVDLLRLDWCPFAKAQFYPFLAYADPKRLQEMKKELTPRLQELLPGVKIGDINKAILFVPEGPAFPRLKAVVFVNVGGKQHRIEIV